MAMNGYELDMMCEGLFDNIEDLLDFSTDDEALGTMGSSGDGAAGSVGGYQQAPDPSIVAPVSVAAVPIENKICDDINIAGDDWITNFLDDTNFDIDFPAAAGIAAAAAPPKNEYMKCSNNDDDGSLFQSFSPVSVLEEPNNLSSSSSISSSNKAGGGSASSSSSSSSSSSYTSGSHAETACQPPVGPTIMLVRGRARSKRPRRAAPARLAVPIVPPAADGPPAVPTLLPECEESFGETCQVAPMRKKKKHHLPAGNAGGSEDGASVRRCQHCGIQKTPQWRAGPMGPKTLCNACGVRYKSGRLFPEYRPAASPTFLPSLHSNSHKRVVEMRNKVSQAKAANGSSSPEYPATKNCDLLAYIRRRE